MYDELIKKLAGMDPDTVRELIKKAKARTPEEQALARAQRRSKAHARAMAKLKSMYAKGTGPNVLMDRAKRTQGY